MLEHYNEREPIGLRLSAAIDVLFQRAVFSASHGALEEHGRVVALANGQARKRSTPHSQRVTLKLSTAAAPRPDCLVRCRKSTPAGRKNVASMLDNPLAVPLDWPMIQAAHASWLSCPMCVRPP
jgi:hypothetical protein